MAVNNEHPADGMEEFTLTLRNAAMVEANVDMRYALKGAADVLEKAIDDMSNYGNAAAMIELNGAWAYGVRLLNLHRTPKKPQPPQAAKVETQPQRKAA